MRLVFIGTAELQATQQLTDMTDVNEPNHWLLHCAARYEPFEWYHVAPRL